MNFLQSGMILTRGLATDKDDMSRRADRFGPWRFAHPDSDYMKKRDSKLSMMGNGSDRFQSGGIGGIDSGRRGGGRGMSQGVVEEAGGMEPERGRFKARDKRKRMMVG